jgi:hypothetical protein
MAGKSPKQRAKSGKKRQPKVSIPLPFDKAVEGLLAVKPKKSAK